MYSRLYKIEPRCKFLFVTKLRVSLLMNLLINWLSDDIISQHYYEGGSYEY